MLRYFIAFLFTLISLSVIAQSSKIDDTKDYLQAKEWIKAKSAIDAASVHNKTKDLVETWYLKGLVYSSLGNEESVKLNYPNAREESFDAFQKAYKLGSTDFLKYVLTYNAGTNPILFLYNSYYQEGANFYNQKKFTDAIAAFKKALNVNDYIAQQPQSNRPLLDTSLVVNIALCYENAGDKNSAADYYQEIANMKIAGETYSQIYRWLCFHFYKTQPDTVKLNKYLFIGKKLYPKDDFYAKIELDRVRNKANTNKEELFDGYEASLSQNPNDLDVLKAYASDLFNYIHPNAGKRPTEVSGKITRLEELYTQILELEKEKKHEVWSDFGKHYYNEYLLKSEDVKPINIKLNSINEQLFKLNKSKKRDAAFTEQKKSLDIEIKKANLAKDNIKTNAAETLGLAIQYLEKAYGYYYSQFTAGSMKSYEKNILKTNIDLLIVCYTEKKDKEKEAFYDKKYSEIK